MRSEPCSSRTAGSCQALNIFPNVSRQGITNPYINPKKIEKQNLIKIVLNTHFSIFQSRLLYINSIKPPRSPRDLQLVKDLNQAGRFQPTGKQHETCPVHGDFEVHTGVFWLSLYGSSPWAQVFPCWVLWRGKLHRKALYNTNLWPCLITGG